MTERPLPRDRFRLLRANESRPDAELVGLWPRFWRSIDEVRADRAALAATREPTVVTPSTSGGGSPRVESEASRAVPPGRAGREAGMGAAMSQFGHRRALLSPAPKESPMPRTRPNVPPPDERRAALREALDEPRTNAELAELFAYYAGGNTGTMLLREDARAIGARRTGNRRSPWTLPKAKATKAPKANAPNPKPAPVAPPEPSDDDLEKLAARLRADLAAVERVMAIRGGR